MKANTLIDTLISEEKTKTVPVDMEKKVFKKISDFKLLSDIFQHFSDVPIYLINMKDIEGEDHE